MVNVAIVGAGFMGQTHLAAYKTMGNARVSAVCDLNEQQGRALAQQAGLEVVQTLSAPVPDVPLQWLTASVYLREYCSILLMFARNIL